MIGLNPTDDLELEVSPTDIFLDQILSGREARDILLTLLDQHINRQKLQNLRAQVNTQAPDPDAQKALQRLQSARASVRHLLSEAGVRGLNVRVRTTVELQEQLDEPVGAAGGAQLSRSVA